MSMGLDNACMDEQASESFAAYGGQPDLVGLSQEGQRALERSLF